jgi:hypothetical protein
MSGIFMNHKVWERSRVRAAFRINNIVLQVRELSARVPIKFLPDDV